MGYIYLAKVAPNKFKLGTAESVIETLEEDLILLIFVSDHIKMENILLSIFDTKFEKNDTLFIGDQKLMAVEIVKQSILPISNPDNIELQIRKLYGKIKMELGIAEGIAERSPSLYAQYKVSIPYIPDDPYTDYHVYHPCVNIPHVNIIDLSILSENVKMHIDRKSIRSKMHVQEYHAHISLLIQVINMRHAIVKYNEFADHSMIKIIPSDMSKPLADEYYLNIRDCVDYCKR